MVTGGKCVKASGSITGGGGGCRGEYLAIIAYVWRKGDYGHRGKMRQSVRINNRGGGGVSRGIFGDNCVRMAKGRLWSQGKMRQSVRIEEF